MNAKWNLRFACEALERFITWEMASAAIERVTRDELLSRFLARFAKHEPFRHELATALLGYPEAFLVGTIRAKNGSWQW